MIFLDAFWTPDTRFSDPGRPPEGTDAGFSGPKASKYARAADDAWIEWISGHVEDA